jgi:hypothetical protein
MIFNTYYWRIELERLARVLRRHMKQRRWRAASDASVEKCVMLGFFSVRKLLDAFQPPPGLQSQVALTTFPRNKARRSPICWPDVGESFELGKPSSENLTLREVCNQIIHSHFFSLWLNPDRTLQGIFFCSDKNKDRKLYRIGIAVIVGLFEQIARADRRTVSLAHAYPDHNRFVM